MAIYMPTHRSETTHSLTHSLKEAHETILPGRVRTNEAMHNRRLCYVRDRNDSSDFRRFQRSFFSRTLRPTRHCVSRMAMRLFKRSLYKLELRVVYEVYSHFGQILLFHLFFILYSLASNRRWKLIFLRRKGTFSSLEARSDALYKSTTTATTIGSEESGPMT